MENEMLRPGGLALTKRALAHCHLQKGACLLDVGCGSGTTVAYLCGQGYAAQGVDAMACQSGQAHILCADAAALPFADTSMDGVLFECSLSKMDAPQKALGEARRVLAPGGWLVVTDLFAKGQAQAFNGLLGQLRHWDSICEDITAAGFALAAFEEHEKALRDYWAQLLFQLGPGEAQEALGGKAADLKAAECSYFLAVFRAVSVPQRGAHSSLGAWVAQTTGTAEGDGQALARWQLERLRGTVARAKRESPFYRQHLAGVKADDLNSWQDVACLPFTDGKILATQGPRMLCVPLGQVARIRTLPTSGSTGPPKRMWFTEVDMARTVDFFAHGMRPMASPGQRVAVLMSDGKPGSIGELLCRGLARYGAVGEVHGPVQDVATAERAVAQADCVVGVPAEVLHLCRKRPHLRPKTVLLSADYVSPAAITAVEEEWQCRVFTHYGLTETCYGLAVQCAARQTQHPRSADYYIEVIHPETGAVLPVGQVGELVLTALRSEALPLIRYRTGDIGRLVNGCACGGTLPGLGRVLGRAANLRQTVNIHRLDDVLFALPGLNGYHARLAGQALTLTLDSPPQDETALADVLGVPLRVKYGSAPPFTGRGKRQLEVI